MAPSFIYFCCLAYSSLFSCAHAHRAHDARAGRLSDGHIHHRRLVSAPLVTSPVTKPTLPSAGPPLVTIYSTSTSFAFSVETTKVPIATICPLPKFNISDTAFRIADISLPNSTYSNYSGIAYPSGGPTAVPVKPSGSLVKPSYTQNLTDDCTTVYSTIATPSCDTTIAIPGALPITVTDCTSPVTFSTSTVPTPFAAPTPDAKIDPLLPPLSNITHPLPTTNGTIAPPSPPAIAPGPPGPGAPRGSRIDYFLAPWTDLAYHPLTPPSTVTVAECLSGAGGESCPSTRTESWSIVNVTTSVPVTRTAAFAGPVTAPAVLVLGDGGVVVSVGGRGVTELDLNTTFTGSTGKVTQSIARSVIGRSGGEGEGEGTVEVSVLPVRTLTTNIGGGGGGYGGGLLTLTENLVSAGPTRDPIMSVS